MLNTSENRRRQSAAAEAKRQAMTKKLQKEKGGSYKVVLTKEGNYQAMNVRTGEKVGEASKADMPGSQDAPAGYSTISTGKTSYSIPTPYTTTQVQSGQPVMAAGPKSIPLSQLSDTQISQISKQASSSWAVQQATEKGMKEQRDWEKTVKPGSSAVMLRDSPYRYVEKGKLVEGNIPAYRELFITELPKKNITFKKQEVFGLSMPGVQFPAAQEKFRTATEKVSIAALPVSVPIEYQLFQARYVATPKIQAGISQALNIQPRSAGMRLTQTGLRAASSFYMPAARMATIYGHEVFYSASHEPLKYAAIYGTSYGLVRLAAIPALKITSFTARHPAASRGVLYAAGGMAVGTAALNVALSPNKARAFAVSSLEFGASGMGFSAGLKSFKPRNILYGEATTTTATVRNVAPRGKFAYESLSGQKFYQYPRTAMEKVSTTQASKIFGISKSTPFSEPYFIKGTMGRTTKLTLTPFYSKGTSKVMFIRDSEIKTLTYKKGKLISSGTTWGKSNPMQKSINQLRLQQKLSAGQISKQPFQSQISFGSAKGYAVKDVFTEGNIKTTTRLKATFSRQYKQTDYTSWYKYGKMEAGQGRGIKKIPKIQYTLSEPKYPASGRMVTGKDYEFVKQAPLRTTIKQIDTLKFRSYITQERVFRMPKLPAMRKGSASLVLDTELLTQIKPAQIFKPRLSYSLAGVSQGGAVMGLVIPRFSQKSKSQASFSMPSMRIFTQPKLKSYTKSIISPSNIQSLSKTTSVARSQSWLQTISTPTMGGTGYAVPPLPPYPEIPTGIIAGAAFRGYMPKEKKGKRKRGYGIWGSYAPDLTAVALGQYGMKPSSFKTSFGFRRPMLR